MRGPYFKNVDVSKAQHRKKLRPPHVAPTNCSLSLSLSLSASPYFLPLCDGKKPSMLLCRASFGRYPPSLVPTPNPRSKLIG